LALGVPFVILGFKRVEGSSCLNERQRQAQWYRANGL